jgi:hypothetical protein
MPKTKKKGSWWSRARAKDKARAKKKAAQREARSDEYQSKKNESLHKTRKKKGKAGYWDEVRARRKAQTHMEDRYGLFWEDKGLTAEEARPRRRRKK